MYRDKVVGEDLTQRATQTGGRVLWRCYTELTATIRGQRRRVPGGGGRRPGGGAAYFSTLKAKK